MSRLTTHGKRCELIPLRLPKRVLAARIRADLAEHRIKRKDVAAWTGRSLKTIGRWVTDDPGSDDFRPTRAEAIMLAYLTVYQVSRYSGDEMDDQVFPLPADLKPLRDRVDGSLPDGT